ncbi:MAG: hypothetical protein Q8880_08885, partial [Bacteroidota bacterium]|nr:hypothetical protein [Bacteroidota bacterium]
NELINENKHLLKIIDEQKEFINNIEEKNKILKIASSINSKENSKEVKLKINEFLREIDKCIALLNK